MSVTLKGKSLKGTVGNQRSLQVTAKPRGNDGISPEITVQEIENGHRVSMKDINGTSTFDVMNGAKGDKGDPGYTPVKGVDYFDGEKGQDGYTPVKGVDYHDGEKGNDGYTPVKGIDYFDGKDGRDGQDGKDGVNGKDGTSVTISSITESDEDGGENVVTFSDGKTLTVKNGNKGDDGEGGGNSVYFSEEEPTDAKTGDFWYDESEGESEEEGEGGGASVQADWNQNDPSAPDYVKNRPFWADDPVETVFFDGTIENDGGLEIELTIGQEYTVVLDGIEYVLTAYEIDGSVVIGSESLWLGEDYVDTEPPFVLCNGWFFTVNEGDEHSLKVVGEVQEVHKIDPKYIPVSFATPVVDLSVYSDFLVSFHLNTDGVFADFGDVFSLGYREVYDAVKWGTQNHAVFYDFRRACVFDVGIEAANEYTNNYESIVIGSSYYSVNFGIITEVRFEYQWYADDDGIVWGNCFYTESEV